MFVKTDKTTHVQSHRNWMVMIVRLLTILLGPSLFFNIPSLAGRMLLTCWLLQTSCPRRDANGLTTKEVLA